MAILSSIARPYALAAFEYAREKQQLPSWKLFLETAADVASDPAVAKILGNPEVPTAKLFEFFNGILAPQISAERKNFLMLLAQHKRFNALIDISHLFNAHYASLEKISKVRVETAIEVQEDFRKKLADSLKHRIKHDVTLECEVNPALIGGAIIHIGDRVIDGSIRGKLSRLLQNLTG